MIFTLSADSIVVGEFILQEGYNTDPYYTETTGEIELLGGTTFEGDIIATQSTTLEVELDSLNDIPVDAKLGSLYRINQTKSDYRIESNNPSTVDNVNVYQVGSNYAINKSNVHFTDFTVDSATVTAFVTNSKDIFFNLNTTDTSSFDRSLTLPLASTQANIVGVTLNKGVVAYKIVTSGSEKIILNNNSKATSYTLEDKEIVYFFTDGTNWRMINSFKEEGENVIDREYLLNQMVGQYRVEAAPLEGRTADGILSILKTKKADEGSNYITESDNMGSINWIKPSTPDRIRVADSLYLDPTGGYQAQRIFVNENNEFNQVRTPGVGFQISSGETWTFSFWARKHSESQDDIVLGVRSLFGASNEVSDTIKTTKWKKFEFPLTWTVDEPNGKIVMGSVVGTLGESWYFFRGQLEPGAEATVSKRTTVDSIATSSKYYLNIQPRSDRLIHLSDVRSDSTDRKIIQASLDYCFETGNCAGVFIDKDVFIDSTIVVPLNKQLISTHGGFGGQAGHVDPITVTFNPYSDTTDFIQAGEYDVNGNSRQARGIVVKGLFVNTLDTARIAMNLNSCLGCVILNNEFVTLDQDTGHYDIGYFQGIDTGNPTFNKAELGALSNVYQHNSISDAGIGYDLLSNNLTFLSNNRAIDIDTGMVLGNGNITVLSQWVEESDNEAIIVGGTDSTSLAGGRIRVIGAYLENIGTDTSHANIWVKNSANVELNGITFNAAGTNSLRIRVDTVKSLVVSSNVVSTGQLINDFENDGSVYTNITISGNSHGSKSKYEEPSIRDRSTDLTLKNNRIESSGYTDGSLQDSLRFSGVNLVGDDENRVYESEVISTTDPDFRVATDSIAGPLGRTTADVFVVEGDLTATPSALATVAIDSTDIPDNGTMTFRFWGKYLDVVGDTVFRIVLRNETDTETNQEFIFTSEWKEFYSTFNIRVGEDAQMVFRTNSGLDIGESFAITQMQAVKGSEKKGYVYTTGTTQLPDDTIRVNLTNNIHFKGRKTITDSLKTDVVEFSDRLSDPVSPNENEIWVAANNPKIHTGSVTYFLTKGLRTTQSIDFASTADGAVATSAFTLTGATVGMPITLGYNSALLAGGGDSFKAEVTSANTVTITYTNNTGSTQDPASGTFEIVVFDFN